MNKNDGMDRFSVNFEEKAMVAGAGASVIGIDSERLSISRLPGHASARTYYRVQSGKKNGTSVIVMVLPPDDSKGEEIGSEIQNGIPFVDICRELSDLGVRVPEIFLVDPKKRFLVIEDLGDITLEKALLAAPEDDSTRKKLYGKAIDQLTFMRCRADYDISSSKVMRSRKFDYELFRWELDHFIEWGINAGNEKKLSGKQEKIVHKAFDDIAERLALLPGGLTHRDYQSRNLMVVAGELAVIDFQDALIGPMVYDITALLRDSYVVLESSFVDKMLDQYCDSYRALGGTMIEREELDFQFDLQTIQRKLKDAGRFVFIDRVRKNPDFLCHIPASLRYAGEALSRIPEYRDLRDILAEYVPVFEGCWKDKDEG